MDRVDSQAGNLQAIDFHVYIQAHPYHHAGMQPDVICWEIGWIMMCAVPASHSPVPWNQAALPTTRRRRYPLDGKAGLIIESLIDERSPVSIMRPARL